MKYKCIFLTCGKLLSLSHNTATQTVIHKIWTTKKNYYYYYMLSYILFFFFFQKSYTVFIFIVISSPAISSVDEVCILFVWFRGHIGHVGKKNTDPDGLWNSRLHLQILFSLIISIHSVPHFVTLPLHRHISRQVFTLPAVWHVPTHGNETFFPLQGWTRQPTCLLSVERNARNLITNTTQACWYIFALVCIYVITWAN